MGAQKKTAEKTINFFVSPEEYFAEAVREAVRERKIDATVSVQKYLSNLLQYYLDARNLFEAESVTETGGRAPKTLAELFLLAQNAEPSLRIGLLKRLADKSLYMSGFFADSFARKIIDVDYYAEMGCTAYRSLSDVTKEEHLSEIYEVFSTQFFSYMDVLGYISQKTQVQNNQSILRLYDNYLRTGSSLAREKLLQMGVLTLPLDQAKLTRQS